MQKASNCLYSVEVRDHGIHAWSDQPLGYNEALAMVQSHFKDGIITIALLSGILPPDSLIENFSIEVSYGHKMFKVSRVES